MTPSQFMLRVLRKLSHVSYKSLSKGAILSARVENKAVKMMLGLDYSLQTRGQMSMEEKVYNAIPMITPLNPSLPATGRKGAVSLVVPSLTSRGFYGGVATAIIFAAKLAIKLKKPLRIIQTLEPGDGEGLDTFFKENDLPLRGEDVDVIDISARRYNFYGYLDLHPEDVYVVSAWWDAYLINQLPLTHRFVYLIQDFEPIFYPNSDKSALADQTYRLDSFIPVCNTELMYQHMSRRGYKHIREEGMFFEPAVSRATSGLSEKRDGKRTMFLYGRPSVDRNLFNLSLLAINEVFGTGKLAANDWEIYMAGQDNIPNISFGSGAVIKNLGKMSMEKYLEFVRTIDVAISPMMAPHPNYPTLEFSSVGAGVVTTRYETKQDLGNYSKNIVMADSSIESLSNAIIKASELTYEERIANAKEGDIGDSWDKALAPVLGKLVEELQDSLPKEGRKRPYASEDAGSAPHLPN